MTRDSESNNKERVIVLVLVSVNTTVSVLSIVGMVYSLTLIIQQQRDITNLETLMHKYMPVEHQTKEHKNTAEHNDEVSEYGIKTRSKVQKEREDKIEAIQENINAKSLISRTASTSTRTKCCGVRGRKPRRHGRKGEKGVNGERGKKGDRGDRGDRGGRGENGQDGRKGEKGADGMPGIKGSKGDQGREGQIVRYMESAHIVGLGDGPIKLLMTNMHPIVAWKTNHLSANMKYNGGYLTVGVDGYYFIYSQMFYYDGRSATIIGHSMYIDEKEVLNTKYSVANTITGKYATKYTSGIFKINSGQNISIATSFNKCFYFNEKNSFFGAFFLHR